MNLFLKWLLLVITFFFSSFGNQDQDQRFKSEFALTASIYGKSLLAVLSKVQITNIVEVI